VLREKSTLFALEHVVERLPHGARVVATTAALTSSEVSGGNPVPGFPPPAQG
jgi:hypothetical protein